MGIWSAATALVVLYKDTDLFRLSFGFLPTCTAMIAVWLVWPVVALVRMGRHWWRGRWVAGAPWGLFPLIAASAIVAPEHVSTDYLFWMRRMTYDRVVSDAEHNGCVTNIRGVVDGIDCQGPIVAVFPWTGFGAIWRGVVYDGSDEIVLEPDQRSEPWRSRRTGPEIECAMVIQPLGGHYYSVIAWGLRLREGVCS